MIREPIVVVGGHVDHGKTTLLDYIRGTAIADKESGKITQHIGATEIPLDTINKLCKEQLKKYKFNLTIPGLLFIDTPGHEAFISLRERGCTIANIAVLIIDIMQGVQPQTIEVINHLKENKTPFVVALTKVDTIKGYNKQGNMTEVLKEIDDGNTLFAQEFNDKFYKILGQLGEQTFNSDRFDKVKEFTKEILMVPVSSKTGLGIPELLLFLAGLSQKFLEEKLELDVKGFGKGTILEIKEEKGFGKTVDVILCDGIINKGDYLKISSKNGLIVSKVKMLLKPKAMQEMRNPKDKFEAVEKMQAASGLKIVADKLDKIVSGDEIEVIPKEEGEKLKTTLKNVKKSGEKGVIIKVDTEGSAEAMRELAKKNDVQVYKVEVGNASKEDITEAQMFKEDSFKYGAVFVFNRKVSLEIEELAKNAGIKIFKSNVIYKIFEDYEKWVKGEEKKIEDNIIKQITYPVEFKIIPSYIFRQSKPLVCGVEIEDGVLKPDIKVIQENKIVGTVKKIQDNGKDIGSAEKGKEVAISIEGTSVDKIDLDKPFYGFIPLKERKYVKKYLDKKYRELIEKTSEIFMNLER